MQINTQTAISNTSMEFISLLRLNIALCGSWDYNESHCELHGKPHLNFRGKILDMLTNHCCGVKEFFIFKTETLCSATLRLLCTVRRTILHRSQLLKSEWSLRPEELDKYYSREFQKWMYYYHSEIVLFEFLQLQLSHQIHHHFSLQIITPGSLSATGRLPCHICFTADK